jgi:hypothetical protein
MASHPVYDKTLRDWLADRISDFGQALKDGKDPQVTFTSTIKGHQPMTLQIRLIDLPGVYTREDIPMEVILDGRNAT